MKNKVFGIDLGAAYSCISYVDDISGEPVVVDNMEGTSVTPSVVYFEDEENYVVGDVAKECAVLDPHHTCQFVKSKMGAPDNKVAITIGEQEFSPEQISAFILKKLVRDAEETFDTKIQDVVITYPTYFGIAGKIAIRNAGEMAGLNVLEMINEPVASALAYASINNVKNKVILVYDLGGATFDVTVFRVTPEKIVKIAEAGDMYLGGKNWDVALAYYLRDAFGETKPDFEGNFSLNEWQDLNLNAEKAKQRLTAKLRTKIEVSISGMKTCIELTREKFNDITCSLLKRTIDRTNDAIAEARKKGVTKIDEIILTGGSCKMPQVKEMLEATYPDIYVKMFEPDMAVVKGAAIYAHFLCESEQIPFPLRNLNSYADEYDAAIYYKGEKRKNKSYCEVTKQLRITNECEVKKMEKKAFGIDLGTTYSCISYVDDISGEPVVVDNMEGTSVTPSVVYFEDEENYSVGDVAKESAVLDPDHTCQFVKRKMGDPDNKVAITIGEQEFSPEQISALILKKLVQDAEEALDTKIQDVVITCPAYFGIAERTATKNAGEMAGLNVLEIINEPTAAALCYGSLRDVEDKVILVYDLGGGTFDVTIIRVTPKEIVAIATDGDHQLGGKDWDAALVSHLQDAFCEAKPDFDGDFDLEAEQELILKAEKAKQQLTAKPSTKVVVSASGMKASIELTRETFDDLTSSLLKRTIDKTNDAIAAAEKKGVTKIDEIILVGGSCKMPQVKEIVTATYPDIPIKMFEPNAAVAKGAAIHANNLEQNRRELQQWKELVNDIIGNNVDIDKIEDIEDLDEETQKEIKKAAYGKGLDPTKMRWAIGGGHAETSTGAGAVLRNITSKSFGIEILTEEVEIVDGVEQRVSKIANLITKQDAVPANVTETFGTAFANQTNVKLVIYETDITEELYDIGSWEPLGDAVLDLPENLPAGAPIEVTLGLSTDGLLTLRGYEPTSDKECNVTFQSDAVLTEEEVKEQTAVVQGLVRL
ncbi:MAG: Hsp70 family protein [Blautia wexlerae]